MRAAVYGFVTVMVLAVIMGFRESLPEPLESIGEFLAYGFDSAIQPLRQYFVVGGT